MNQRILTGVLISIAVLCSGAMLAFRWLGLRWNLSESLPSGLYRVDIHGSMISFCPESIAAVLSRERGYRTVIYGRSSCPDGPTPLMKPLAAQGNDVVDVSSDGVMVNGRLIPNSKPLPVDRLGRKLPKIFGRYVVKPDEVWVISSYSPRSFDSRYFGPISVTTIRERLSPFLVWH